MIDKIFNFTKGFDNKEEIILRDYLALERTKLANERTLLSYIRTSLYLLLGGVAIVQLEGFGEIKWVGYMALYSTLLTLLIGIVRFYHLKKYLKKAYAPLDRKVLEERQSKKQEGSDKDPSK